MEFMMMELGHQLHHRSEPSFEDDLYYAELERQILLLTADDDDDDVVVTDNSSVFGAKTPLPLIISPAKHASSGSDMVAAVVVRTDFLMWQQSYNNHRGSAAATPPWQNKSNGTGVFIPQTIVLKSQTSRTSTTGRMNYDGRRMKRQTTEYKHNDQCVSSPGSNKRDRIR